MFLIEELPTTEEMQRIQKRFPILAPTSMMTLGRLLKIGSDLLLGFEVFLNKYSFTQGRFLMLMVLYRTPNQPLNPALLAKKLGIKKPTASGLIAKLLNQKLVNKIDNDQDKRMYHIQINQLGIQKLEATLPEYFYMIKELTLNLEEKEKIILIDLLNKIDSPKSIPPFSQD